MKLFANFAASPALIVAERDGVTVNVYAVAGGYAFEVVGAFANAGAFVGGAGEPFATPEAALAVANDPESDDVCEYEG